MCASGAPEIFGKTCMSFILIESKESLPLENLQVVKAVLGENKFDLQTYFCFL